MRRRCVIFDLDGTLADDSHRREHMVNGDWDKYFSLCPGDTVIRPIAACAEAFHADGATIVVITGRSESVRRETLDWLAELRFFVDPDLVFMRPAGDFRKNSEVKLEALAKLRALGYDPQLAFDDQPATCKMWRDAGIMCCQVAGEDGFIEYRVKA